MTLEKDTLIREWEKISNGEGRIIVDDKGVRIHFTNYKGGLFDPRHKFIDEYIRVLSEKYPYATAIERFDRIDIVLNSEDRRAVYSDYPREDRKVLDKYVKEKNILPAEEIVTVPTPNLLLDNLQEFLHVNKTDISKSFTGTEILKRDSASDTVFIKGDLRLLDRLYGSMLKLGFDHRNLYDNRDEVEAGIYKYIIQELREYTPHILDYYGYYRCKNIKFSDKKFENDFTKELDRFRSRVYPDKMSALFLERINGNSLRYRYESLDPYTLSVILFQVSYTLLCFERYNMVHIDLHDGNVLLEDLPEPEATYYRIDSKTYRVESNIRPLVFDFDRARVYDRRVSRNLILDADLCRKYRTCNKNTVVDDIRNLFGFISVETSKLRQFQGFKFPVYNNIEDYMFHFLNAIMPRINVVDYNPLYIYKIPEEKMIRVGKPHLTVPDATTIDLSLISNQPRYQERLRSVAEIWVDECKKVFEYDFNVNFNILFERYKVRYINLIQKMGNGTHQRRVFDECLSYIIYYLSLPMFYKLNKNILFKSLTQNEYIVLSDIMFYFNGVIPIELPLI